jgi:hypothetical protein
MTSSTVPGPNELADLIEQFAGSIVAALRGQPPGSEVSSVPSQTVTASSVAAESVAVSSTPDDGSSESSPGVLRWPPSRN